MKTIILVASVFMSSFSYSLANNGTTNGDTKENGKSDSTEVRDEKTTGDNAFEVKIVNNTVEVIANGDFDPYASISLTTNRGSDIFFEFLQQGSNVISFDVSKLEEGSYFIILNSNEEVRIKRFLLD